MTGRSPLVSIIVRSMNRDLLGRALHSVAMQSHDGAEVLVVAASGRGHRRLSGACGRFSMDVVGGDKPLARPQAANAGLDRARGEWLAFLDDDDQWEAIHLERLLRSAMQHPHHKLVYSRSRMHDSLGRFVRYYGESYGRLSLLTSNALSINAAIAHRNLLSLGCRFDESLPVLEDWDFWLQATVFTDAVHIEDATALVSTDTGTSGCGGGNARDDRVVSEFMGRLDRKWGRERAALSARVEGALRYAREHFSAGRLTHCIAAASEVLRLSPRNPAALNLMGAARFRERHLAEAIAYFRRGLEADPKGVPIYVNLVAALEASGTPQEAARPFAELMSLAPQHPFVQARVGAYLKRSGR